MSKKKVYISGSLKTGKNITKFDGEGILVGKNFYPDANNARIFLKVNTCHVGWDSGVLVDYMEVLEDD